MEHADSITIRENRIHLAASRMVEVIIGDLNWFGYFRRRINIRFDKEISCWSYSTSRISDIDTYSTKEMANCNTTSSTVNIPFFCFDQKTSFFQLLLGKVLEKAQQKNINEDETNEDELKRLQLLANFVNDQAGELYNSNYLLYSRENAV